MPTPVAMKISMKTKFLSSFRRSLAAPGALLGCALLLCGSASAQNFLKNGDFETPLDPWDPTGLSGGKTNWTLVYASGGPGDFAVKDRTTDSSRHGSNGHGVHFRPRTDWWCHAYFTQTVSNLTAGANYIVSGYMNRVYQLGALDIYFEALGGPSGTTSVSVHTPYQSNTGWVQYFVTNTASSTGTLTVRLHMNKAQTAWAPNPGEEKYWYTDGMFDDFSMTAQ